MKVLVTGGAGFIGSHTCIELLRNNHNVHVIDNLITGNKESLRRVKKISGSDLSFTKVDILDKNQLRKVFKQFKPDVVIHFAGLKSVNESLLNPIKYYKFNIYGSINLLDIMTEFNCKKIIFSSSATVYGEPEFLPINENHPTRPTNPYGQSKLMVEQIIKDWTSKFSERSSVILRYFNPIGAHPSGLIGESVLGMPNNLMPFILQVASGIQNELSIFGDNYETEDGTGKRDYIHIVDLAQAHVAAINTLISNNDYLICNLGTGKSYSVYELVDAMERVTKIKINLKIIGKREGDLAEVWADTSFAEKILNWKSTYNLDDMCQDAWNWQIKNPEGY